MTLKIRRAAVLGAGVMGAQIAAHLAAAGVRTYLLDLPSTEPPTDKSQAKLVGAAYRSARAILAIENLRQLKPTPLFSKRTLSAVIPGNFDDDMSVLAECDWIIEAVAERLDIKKAIHQKIAAYAPPGVPITTNTSGLSLASIVEDMPSEYSERFFGTHFFNPPRYMHLLEIIPHAHTNRKLMGELTSWTEERLGKGIVEARDTVNFIANRLGVFSTLAILRHAGELNLNFETVDKLTGPLIGRAKSATLRTMDVVGLDTFRAVARNTYERAPKDPYRDWFLGPKWLDELVEQGALGQKSANTGCFKKIKTSAGKSEILAYRPVGKTYEPMQTKVYAWEEAAAKERNTIKRLKLIFQQQDEGAELCWRAVRDVLSYAACLVEEIADGRPKPVDDALKWGFNWEYGPFELWHMLGFDDVFKRMKKDQVALPTWAKPGVTLYANDGGHAQFNASKDQMQPIPRPSYEYRLPQKNTSADSDPRVILTGSSASLVDLGDGIACLTFHSKMNSIDADIIETSIKAVNHVQRDFDALVVGNEGAVFSAGANLQMIAEAIETKRWNDIDQLLRRFQGAMQLIKFAPFPSVAAPFGMTLGGGCEVALHTTARVAAGETYAGLVEVGVGLIPAGGGTKELALRCYDLMTLAERPDPMPFLQRAFLLIGMGRVSSSAHEAVEMGLFPASTHITLSRKHLIERAKQTALAMVREGYVPRSPATAIQVVGDPGIQTFKLMLYNMVQARQISAYDAFIGEKVATVLCGGEVDGGAVVNEQWFLDLERRVFVELCQQSHTGARIEHMLKTGKPLRN